MPRYSAPDRREDATDRGESITNQRSGKDYGYSTPFTNNAGRWTNERAGCVSVCSTHGKLSAWARLCGLAGSGAAPAFLGGKERLGRISKAGQADIRRLLIMGAMSRLNWLVRKTIPERSWLSGMLARKPRMLVAIALANKMARAIWANHAIYSPSDHGYDRRAGGSVPAVCDCDVPQTP